MEQNGTLDAALEKLKDIEVSHGRELTRPFAAAVFLIGLAMSLFHIYVLIFHAIDPWYFRTMHVVFAGVLTFAFWPGWKTAPRNRFHLLDYILMLMLITPAIYIFWNFDDWIFRAGVLPTQWDFFFAVLFVIAVMEMARRTTGWALVILAAIFIVYGYFGHFLPGFLSHKGYPWDRLFTYLFSLEGIFSIPILSSAHYVFLFVVFGAFVDNAGAGKFFVDFAMCVAGRRRGGPAKVSIVSSAIIGTTTGSAVANVVVDGVFNIPLMIASGFRSATSAAIEAMNSTGGQIVPPVMAAGAFLMAEILGVPYSQVAIAAVGPAILYYGAAYFMIDFYAARSGLKGVSREQLPVFKKIMSERGHFAAPIVVLLIALMILMYSPQLSAAYAILTLIVVSWVKKETRFGLRAILKALADGAQKSVAIVSTCAVAGIIVGILSLTGLGVKFATSIMLFSGGNQLLALLLAMVICIFLGMGMPTTAAYAITACVLAPGLIEVGIAPLAAHMFIFYFACISALTPPVAVAAYAAAAIAKANPWEVGLQSVKFAIAGFIIPYMFVFGPQILLQGGFFEVVLSIITGLFGVMALAAAAQGWFLGNIGWTKRIALLISALLLIKPGWITDLIGFGILVLVLVSQIVTLRRSKA